MFRYYRDDFGKVPFRVIHMDLTFDVFDNHTYVTSDLHAESHDSPLFEVVLNAKNLDIVVVLCAGHPCSHLYDATGSTLTIRFEESGPAADAFRSAYRNNLPPDKKYP